MEGKLETQQEQQEQYAQLGKRGRRCRLGDRDQLQHRPLLGQRPQRKRPERNPGDEEADHFRDFQQPEQGYGNADGKQENQRVLEPDFIADMFHICPLKEIAIAACDRT